MAHWQERTREKPRIIIYSAPGAAPHHIRQVELGLEEEGVPSQLQTGREDTAVSLAWEAATLSPLGTGIGIGRDGIAVHYYRLKEDKPLFFVSDSELEEGECRRLGTNAARLVKGIPFRSKNQEPSFSERELVSTIVATVLKVLQESGIGKEGSF